MRNEELKISYILVFILIVAVVVVLAGCDGGEYSRKAIKERKEALKEHQQTALKAAQETLERADRELQALEVEYKEKKEKVDKAREALKATEEEIRDLWTTKKKLDSVRVVFETECEKIKYIHKKQKDTEEKGW